MSGYLNNPMGIENQSMAIIDRELNEQVRSQFSDAELTVVKRVIHTTADFEYAELIRFQHEPIQHGLEVLQQGCKIYVDTNMIRAGVNKRKLAEFRCELINYVADEEVRALAKKEGVTRSSISMRKACQQEVGVFVIGNAPTALFTLMELIEQGKVQPDLIIGVPVGFVGAAQSKAQLLQLPVPSISIQGRKGGSTVAVSIVNALFYLLNNER